MKLRTMDVFKKLTLLEVWLIFMTLQVMTQLAHKLDILQINQPHPPQLFNSEAWMNFGRTEQIQNLFNPNLLQNKQQEQTPDDFLIQRFQYQDHQNIFQTRFKTNEWPNIEWSLANTFGYLETKNPEFEPHAKKFSFVPRPHTEPPPKQQSVNALCKSPNLYSGVLSQTFNFKPANQSSREILVQNLFDAVIQNDIHECNVSKSKKNPYEQKSPLEKFQSDQSNSDRLFDNPDEFRKLRMLYGKDFKVKQIEPS